MHAIKRSMSGSVALLAALSGVLAVVITGTHSGAVNAQSQSDWSAQTSGTQSNLNRIHIVDQYNGWAVGDGGTILRSADGGITWSDQISDTNRNLNGVYALSAERGAAVANFGTVLDYNDPSPPFLDLSPFHQCCIYEERNRQQLLLRVELVQPQAQDVPITSTYDLGETTDNFEIFEIPDVTVPTSLEWISTTVTATPRDDALHQREKRLTITAATGGETHRATQDLKPIDNDSPDQVTVASMAVSTDGLVTWERAEAPVSGQAYLLRWVSGDSPPRSAASKDAPGYMNGWIAGRDCGASSCRFSIAGFDTALHYLVEVRSVLGHGDHSWQSTTDSPAEPDPGPGPTTPAGSPAVRVSPTALSVDEDGGSVTYAVSLEKHSTGTVTISVTGSDSGAERVSHSSLTFTTSKWSTPQTVTVTGVNDDEDNPNDARTVTIRHSASGGGYDGVGVDSVKVTVRDDDSIVEDPSIALSTNAIEIAEDIGNAAYGVSLAVRPSGTVTVTVSSSDTSAVTVGTSALTFTTDNWSTRQLVWVYPVDDDRDNPGDARVVLITHTPSGGGYDGVSVDPVTVTVRDDD